MALKCEKCDVLIMWFYHHETRDPAPLEVNPHPNGNIVIQRETKKYRIATQADYDLRDQTGKNLYINHFATCVKASEFRKKKSKEKGKMK